MTTDERLRADVDQLRKQVDQQEIRLTLAQAWIGLYQYAYDALLHYGVNFRSLKEFADTSVLDEALQMPLSQARNKIVEYLGGLKNAIRAAVNRKQFKVH